MPTSICFHSKAKWLVTGSEDGGEDGGLGNRTKLVSALMTLTTMDWCLPDFIVNEVLPFAFFAPNC